MAWYDNLFGKSTLDKAAKTGDAPAAPDMNQDTSYTQQTIRNTKPVQAPITPTPIIKPKAIKSIAPNPQKILGNKNAK